MFPKTFCLTVALGLSALVSINFLPIRPFDPDLPTTTCAGTNVGFDAKFARIAQDLAFDVMLFGNSRIIAVGAEELGLPGIRVFNTAFGGTSFRQSVAMLEMVAASDRLPRVAVLSFDHVSLLYAQNPIDWPLAPRRYQMVLRDGLALPFAPHAIKADIRSYFKYLFNQEINHLAKLVNINLLLPRIQALAGLTPPCPTAYRADGSRPWPKRYTADLGGGPLPSYDGLDARYPLLEHDLDRLAALQARGTQVVIYESPMLPAMNAVIEPRLHIEQRTQRQRLEAGAKARGLHFFPSPVIHGSDADGYWSDTNHAPPPALGRFIAGLVAPLLTAKEARP